MSEPSEDTGKALQMMLDYLQEHYSYQLTSLQNVDSKINIRLTMYAGLLGLVTLGLPALANREIPSVFLWAAVVSVVLFGVCLFRTLWLALKVLDVKVDLPGVRAGAFRRAAGFDTLASLQVLRDLVVNYSRAVEKTWAIVEERVAPGDALKKWSRWTLVMAFISVGCLGIVYVFAPPEKRPAASERSQMANQEDKPQASASTSTGQTQSGQEAQPSLQAEPMRIELGRSAGEGDKQAIVTVVPEPKNTEKKD